MHRGRSQKLNKVLNFLSLRGRRRHDGDVGDITINAFPYRRKRPSSIADPLLGHVPVVYDDMETRLKLPLKVEHILFLHHTDHTDEGILNQLLRIAYFNKFFIQLKPLMKFLSVSWNYLRLPI